jgi:hypothetical protein
MAASPRKATSAASASSSAKKPKWNAGYTKEITLFKQQTDYFQLNEKYAKM